MGWEKDEKRKRQATSEEVNKQKSTTSVLRLFGQCAMPRELEVHWVCLEAIARDS